MINTEAAGARHAHASVCLAARSPARPNSNGRSVGPAKPGERASRWLAERARTLGLLARSLALLPVSSRSGA